MIKLLELSIQGFKSFSNVQTIDFSTFENGLYYISGINNVEIELGSNAVGKSSLAEALCVCLYGKTSTNLRAGDVINWKKQKPCILKLTIEKNNVKYIIKRTLNPNQLTLSEDEGIERVITQEYLDDFLGVNFQSFVYSVYISQFASKFFDLLPSEKLDIFSLIVGDELKVWDNLSEQSKINAALVDKEILLFLKSISFKEGKINALTGQNYDSMCKEWEDKKKALAVDLMHKYEVLKKTLSKQNIELREVKYKIEELDKSIKEQMSKMLKQSEDLAFLTSKKEKLESKLIEQNTEISIAKRNKNRITLLTGIICEACFQVVSQEHSKNVLKSIEDTLRKYEDSFNKLKAEFDGILLFIGEAKSKYNTLSKENKILNEKGIILKNSRFRLEVEIKSIERDIESIKKTIEESKLQKNPYTELIQKNKSTILLHKRDLLHLKNQYNESKELLEIYTYWIKGFNEIRLLSIIEMLDELEVNINNNLSSFGLNNFIVKLNIDTETKAGGIKKGFIVTIVSLINKQQIPLDILSGGEIQRLKLAGTLGLMSFIQTRKGNNFNIEIFDEPTAHLSNEGINNLLDSLQLRASEQHKKIFVIEHKDFSSLGIFTKNIIIVKETNGSYIKIKE